MCLLLSDVDHSYVELRSILAVCRVKGYEFKSHKIVAVRNAGWNRDALSTTSGDLTPRG
jgi:hypothetical protein